MFKYSYNNKRYHTLDYYYKTKYNSKVFKVNLNLGLSCPNKDGTCGTGGCIYCKSGGSFFGGNKNRTGRRREATAESKKVFFIRSGKMLNILLTLGLILILMGI